MVISPRGLVFQTWVNPQLLLSALLQASFGEFLVPKLQNLPGWLSTDAVPLLSVLSYVTLESSFRNGLRQRRSCHISVQRLVTQPSRRPKARHKNGEMC